MTDLDQCITAERDAARRHAFEEVLREIDGLQGNEIYRRAWKKLALRVRTMLNTPEAVNTTH